MSSVTDLRSIGISYTISTVNEKFVKSIYVLDLNDILDSTGQYSPEYETVNEHISYALTRLKNFFDLSRISWKVFRNSDYCLEKIAKIAYEEGTDIVVVEFIEDEDIH